MAAVKAAGATAKETRRVLDNLCRLTDECKARVDHLQELLDQDHAGTPEKHMAFFRDTVIPAMVRLRETGVKLEISTAQAVREVYADFAARLGERLEGVLVQKMVTGGVEMVVGAMNDPAFGPLVMCGTGGIFVELVGDTVFRMCP
ncbi:MAG: acetate--CoA ligase family protein [Acidobacteria bacterium]|nr:acetate--CoA ligase family protein [Acidobacteriota bacterium]